MHDWKVSAKRWKRVIPAKWRRFCFVISVFGGVTLSRFSRNRFVKKFSSFLGLIVRKKEIRGESVEMLELDTHRRAFLKYVFFGGLVFLAGKYITPFINLLRGDTIISEKTFKNFKVTEMGRQLKVTSDEGDELLIIDKESF